MGISVLKGYQVILKWLRIIVLKESLLILLWFDSFPESPFIVLPNLHCTSSLLRCQFLILYPVTDSDGLCSPSLLLELSLVPL